MKRSISNRANIIGAVLVLMFSMIFTVVGGCRCVSDRGDVSYSAGAVYSLGGDNDGQVIVPGDRSESSWPASASVTIDAISAGQEYERTSAKQSKLLTSDSGEIIYEQTSGYDQPATGFTSRLGFASMTEQTTLEEAIKLISNSTQPPVNIIVNWRDLSQNTYIDKDTSVGMKGMKGIKVRKALELVLMSVAGNAQTLGYSVDDNVVTVATLDTLSSRKMTTKVYDVTDILSSPGDFFTAPNLLNSTVRY